MSDWIEWAGGECPVPPETMVEIQVRTGKKSNPGNAGGWCWSHSPIQIGDIIAYRVVSPTPAALDMDELERGLEGVTPGPWAVASDLPAYAIMSVDAEGRGRARVVQTPNQNNYRHFGPSNSWDGIQSFTDAAHIARCDPQTIHALIDRVRAAEQERDEAKRIATNNADMWDEACTMVSEQRSRAEAAEAERDTLRHSLLALEDAVTETKAQERNTHAK